MSQIIPITEVIEPTRALARAVKHFSDVDPDWSGDVTVEWLESNYYGLVSCWALDACGVTFLVDPSYCTHKYARRPLHVVRPTLQSSVTAFA